MTRFRLIRELGAGGMGVVYEAFDHEHNAHVALKTLRHLTPEAIDRFKREFRALQDVRHPNLISLGELFEVSGSWFFTMELVDGTDFLSWVRPRAPGGEGAPPPLDVERLRAGLVQLAGALSALHAAGKVHRDVKPSNVRVTPGGRVTLLDFGLVREVTSDGALSGDGPVGTTAYMAPEQAAGANVGPEADWYAFGTLLFEVLTGRLPFQGGILEVMLDKQRREPPPASSFGPVPAELDELARLLLSFDPSRRPTSAQVLERLGGTPATTTVSSGPPLGSFVGRATELERLEQAYIESQRGESVAVTIRGESGVGKSALVRRFTERLGAHVDDLLVVASRCYEREAVPYKAMDGAMEGLARHLKRLDPVDAALVVGSEAGLVARLFPALSQVPVVRRASTQTRLNMGAQELRERAFAALRDLFTRLGERQPLVLIVDDLQWADADSLTLLSALLRGPRAPRLLLLATTRPGGAAQERLALELPGLRVIDLGGLAPEEARTLATQLSGRLGVDVDAGDIVREADGHPLFLHELVRHAALVGPSPDGGRVGIRLEEALLRRVDALEPAAQRLLEVVALAAAPVPARVASVAVQLEPADGMRMASVLRVAMLARSAGPRDDERIEPFHDRVRAAVASRLSQALAGELHARLADALEADGHQDPRLLVFHLEAGGQPRRAAELAERAAGLATGALAYDRAAELYATALRLGAHAPAERRHLHERLGDVLAATGRCVEAADAYMAILDGHEDATTRTEFRRRAAEQLLIAGDVERGLAGLRVVLAEFGLKLPTTPGGAIAALVWNTLKLRVRGLSWKPRDASLVSPRDRQLLELQRSVAIGLSHVEYVRGADFNVRCLLLALRTGQPWHVASSLLLLAPLRASEGLHRRARVEHLLAEARRIVEGSGDPVLKERVLGATGLCEYVMGDFAAALPKLDAADQALRELGGGAWQANNYRLFLMLGLHYLGRYVELETRLERYEREARPGHRWMESSLALARNILWLAHDEVDKVRQSLEAAWQPPETGFFQLQSWYQLLIRCALALHTGDRSMLPGLHATLARVERSPLMRMQIARVEHHANCGRLALLEGDLDEVRRRIPRLLREKVGHADARASLLLAGLDPSRANLAAAAACCEANGLEFMAQMVRFRLGEPDLEEWFRARGVRSVENGARMLMPMRA